MSTILSSEHQIQHWDNVVLPAAMSIEQHLADNTSLHHLDQPQSVINTDAFSEPFPTNALQDLNLDHSFSPETQTWTPDDGQQQWSLSAVNASSYCNNILQHTSTRICAHGEQYALDIQPASSQLLHTHYPPTLPIADPWFLPTESARNLIESSSTLPTASNFGVTIGNIPLDFSLLDLPGPAVNPLQIASPGFTVSSIITSPPDISSTVSSNTYSLSSPIVSQSILFRPHTSIPDISQNAGPSQFTDRNSLPQLGNKKRKADVPVLRPQPVNKRKSIIPGDMIHCMKFPLLANSRPKQTSDKRKQRPCLICQMHKKQVFLYRILLFVKSITDKVVVCGRIPMWELPGKNSTGFGKEIRSECILYWLCGVEFVRSERFHGW